MSSQRVDVDLNGRHLVVGMPAYSKSFPSEFQDALIRTLAACRKHGVKVTIAERGGSALIDKTRDEIVHAFLRRTDGTDLLFIDADIVWEPSDVLRLLVWSQERQFVVAPYCTKGDNPEFYYDLVPDESGHVVQDRQGLIQLKSAPSGFSLIRRDALTEMVDSYPELRYLPQKGEFKGEEITALHLMHLRDNGDGTRSRIGEDIAFCNRWTALDGEIWMDPGITLGHIGRKVYRMSYPEWIAARQPIATAT